MRISYKNYLIYESYIDKDGKMVGFVDIFKPNITIKELNELDNDLFKEAIDFKNSNDEFLPNEYILDLTEEKNLIYFECLIENNMWLVLNDMDFDLFDEYLNQILMAIEYYPSEFEGYFETYLKENLKGKSDFDLHNLKILQTLDIEKQKLYVDCVKKYGSKLFYISEEDMNVFEDKIKNYIESINFIEIY